MRISVLIRSSSWGDVSGTIDAKERVEVHPPGRVSGDIEAGVISIEPGGVFNGNCGMKAKTGSDKKTGCFSQDSFHFSASQRPIKFSKNPLTTGWCGCYRPREPSHPFSHFLTI